MSESIYDYFSPDEFRVGQKEAITKVAKAFNSGKKIVVLEAPTGIGKSHIGATFARYYNNTHVLTVQKILQDQYGRDFKDEMFIMKGRGAYTCLLPGDNGNEISCAVGKCRTDKQVNCGDACPYKTAVFKAKAEPIVVHNFDGFHYQNLAKIHTKRKFMLIDEAHNIENKFLGFVAFTISNKKDRSLKIPEFNSISDYDLFLNTVLKEKKEQLALVEELAVLTQEEFKEIEDLKNLVNRVENYFETSKHNSFVFEYRNHGLYQTVEFKPLYVSNFVKRWLLPYGDKILMMSATFLNKELFCKSIGVDPNEVEYITLPAVFPKENRPVVFDPVGSMSYANINNTLPKMIRKIKDILEDHPDVKGIIHTVSERIATYIKDNLKDRRLTFRRDFVDVNNMLIEHTIKPSSIIVASGLKEGLDLHGDLSRLQIIAKVPYPSLGDKRVKKRADIEKGWYGYMTCLAFIQSLGRSVRSVKDMAVTYVLDKDFNRFIGMNKKYIPAYVKESFMDAVDYYN